MTVIITEDVNPFAELFETWWFYWTFKVLAAFALVVVTFCGRFLFHLKKNTKQNDKMNAKIALAIELVINAERAFYCGVDPFLSTVF